MSKIVVSDSEIGDDGTDDSGELRSRLGVVEVGAVSSIGLQIELSRVLR
jgi:hypothetical protein